MRLHTLQAGHGDCLIIEYGDNPKQQHVVIIDGGVAGETTPTLKKLLQGWPTAQIELLAVTHIDDDHIVGAVRLLKSKHLRERIKDIWFNGSVEKRAADLQGLGFKKGNELETMLTDEKLMLPWNASFGGADAVVNASKVNQRVSLPLGASITLLSPTADSLRALRKAWAEGGPPQEGVAAAAEPEAAPPPRSRTLGQWRFATSRHRRHP